jgi:DNA-binding LacI/PurR family transcriptional regulator
MSKENNPAVAPSGEASEPATSRRRKRRPGAAAISLADVALAAGVSTASSSRALARPELVSEAVRVRVIEAASRLGYVANAAARSLSTQRSGLVGAVLGDPADPVALKMLEAAERSLCAHGVGLLVRVACAASAAAACAQMLAARGVDGLLFAGSGAMPGRETWKAGVALPCIGCGQPPGSDAALPGETIERRGLALARAYLAQLGHAHVGILRLRRDEGADQQTASQAAATGTTGQVDRLDDADAVRAGVRRLIESAVTAIVTLSDVAAVAALRECRALGITVPGQISVIGWGDTALARCVDPQLTSVRVPASASGQAAAEYLIAALAGRTFTWPDLPLKLAIRESTGPASA